MPITAVIFSVLEGDDLGLTFAEGSWSFLNSLYFTFITFSTIGFGDMVPGAINISFESCVLEVNIVSSGASFVLR